MSATEELRRMLDERGLSHPTHYLYTSWSVGSKLYVAMDNLDGTLTVDNLTPEQAIAATLGSGTLTAEQVRKVLLYHLPHREYYSVEQTDAWQAIADELNELGSGTCSIVKTWSDSDYVDDWRYRCSECGCNIPVNERDPETGDVISAANYCPNCGAKVVSE